MPAGLGQRAGVDEVDPLGRDRLEQAAQDRRGERRGVVLGELAGDLEGQRAHAAARELGEEPAEDLGQRQVRRDGPRRLGGEQRGVDGVARAAGRRGRRGPARRPPRRRRPGPPRSRRRGAGSAGCSARRAAASRSAARSRRRRCRRRRGGPSARASATAASSTTPPRATLRTIDAGLAAWRSPRAPMSPRVARVSGTWTVTTSARARSVSKSTSSTPWLAACSAVTNGSLPRTTISMARARTAMAWPILPRPTIPSVRPRSSRPVNWARFHSPRRTLASAAAVRRATP